VTQFCREDFIQSVSPFRLSTIFPLQLGIYCARRRETRAAPSLRDDRELRLSRREQLHHTGTTMSDGSHKHPNLFSSWSSPRLLARYAADQAAAATTSAADTRGGSEAISAVPAKGERMLTPTQVVPESKPSLPTGKRSGVAISASSEEEPKPKRMRATVKPSTATQATTLANACKSQKARRRESDSSTGSSSSSVSYGPTDLRPNLFSSWNSPRLLARNTAAQAAAAETSTGTAPADSEAASAATATRLPRLSPVAVVPQKTVKGKKLGKERSAVLHPVGAPSLPKNKPGLTAIKQSSIVFKASQPAVLSKKSASAPQSEEVELKAKRANTGTSKTKCAQASSEAKKISAIRTPAPLSRLAGSSTSAKSTRSRQSTSGTMSESGPRARRRAQGDASASGGAREHDQHGQQRQRQQQKQPWKR
jgi:hypothetical protein